MAACLLSHFAGNKNLSLFGKMRTSSHHHKWITSVGRRYASPHHTTCHVCNLLVHLSLHSCENQWSFLNGNWLLNHVSVALFFSQSKAEETMMHCSSASLTFQFVWPQVLPPVQYWVSVPSILFSRYWTFVGFLGRRSKRFLCGLLGFSLGLAGNQEN